MIIRIAGLALGAAALAGCGAAPPAHLAAPPGSVRVDCVNQVSGFRWTLRLDPVARTVDGWPATFGAKRISWRDGADGAGYDLDRATGALTVTRASSTGGAVNVDSCRSAPS
jgi:hypothetical protein